MKRACVFAHYDKDNIVDEYVYYYLKELLTVVQKLIFVSVSDILSSDIEKLQKLNIDVIKRENIGYDFYSYKVGLKSLELENFDELIICNDSVYGPLFPLESVFEKMKEKKDVWGITESNEIYRHLQSYFIVYTKEVFLSKYFQDFWKNLEIIEDKNEIIKKYEVGFSKLLLENNFILNSYVDYKVNRKDTIIFMFKRFMKNPRKNLLKFILLPRKYFNIINSKSLNITHTFWNNLISEYQMPFVKISKFTIESERKDTFENLNKLEKIISKYPIKLIRNHLDRVLS